MFPGETRSVPLHVKILFPLLVVLISWLSFPLHCLAATSCAPGLASVIGTEYVATACPWESSVYTYRGIDLICQNGNVTRDPNSSGDTSYGNLTPNSLQNILVSQAQYFGMKVFRNTEGTRFLVVTKYFGNGGSIDGKSMTSYPPAPAINTDVFSKVIYVDPALKPPCCLKIKYFSSDKASITPSVGEKVTFSGSIFSNYPLAWNLSIADRLFNGNGTTVTVSWDGNDGGGTVVAGGTYSVGLTVQTMEMACTESASINVTVKNDACVDSDGDGYPAISPTCQRGNDCNDTDARVYPNAPEICGDQKDNNCNGETDESCRRERCLEVSM